MMARLILILMAAVLSLPAHSAWSAALPERPAANGGPGAEKERAVARERRFLLRVLDDLLVERKLAEEDIRELELNGEW